MVYHILSNTSGKSWQGYVGVPKGHPLFGLDYRDDIPGGITVDPSLVQTDEQLIENKGVFQLLFVEVKDYYCPISWEFDVHGGITYSGHSYWTRKPVIIEQDLITSKFLKMKRLVSRCGNDLFSHWYTKDRNLYPTEGPALRVKNFREALKDVTLPTLTSEDGVTSSNYWADGTSVELGNDKYWWFGWDTNHGKDHTEDEAIEQTKWLLMQMEQWTVNFYNK